MGIEQDLGRIADALQRIAAVQEAMLDKTIEDLDAGQPTVPATAVSEPEKPRRTRRTKAEVEAAKAKAAPQPQSDPLLDPEPVASAVEDPKEVEKAVAKVLKDVNGLFTDLGSDGKADLAAKLTQFMRGEVFPRLGIRQTREAKTMYAVNYIREQLEEWKKANLKTQDVEL